MIRVSLCLVLLRLRRTSISRSVQISTSLLKHLLKRVLCSWVPNIQLLLVLETWIWCEKRKQLQGNVSARRGHKKGSKRKQQGFTSKYKRMCCVLLLGKSVPTHESFLWLNSSQRTAAVLNSFWMLRGTEEINEQLCSQPIPESNE